MAVLGIVIMVVFALLCVVVRSAIHWRRTGGSPFRRGSADGPLAIAGFTTVFVGAELAHALGLEPLWESRVPAVAGAVIAAGGIAFTMWCQLAMGESWRIGIDEQERTALVTGGPYRYVRNPIYTGMFAVVIGFVLVLPNVVALLGFVAVIGAMETVVRRIEEPYLASMHGGAFATWAASAGRFLPGVGRLQM